MRRAIALVSLALLAACARGAEAPAKPPGDPLLETALSDPIASDPDLAAQNRANAVASLPTLDGSVPTLDVGPDAIDRARADAVALIGGPGEMREAVSPIESEDPLPPEASLSVGTRAAYTPGTGKCAAKVRYTAEWAAHMPVAFPVYPRGAVQEAAGTDDDGCALRAVNFQTPAPVGDVIDFYYSLARRARFSARRVTQGKDDVLSGVNGPASYSVYARKLTSGATEVDLVTRG